MKLIHKREVVGPFQCNCHILACPVTGHALVVDPGDEPSRLIESLKKLKTASGAPIIPKLFFHTHAHLDHVGATRGLKEAFPDAKIALHADDEAIYKILPQQGQMFGIKLDEPAPLDLRLEDGQEIKVGELALSCVHTPGHSPGGLCLRLHESQALGAPEWIFTGDTLFQGSIGRTDLWGGDHGLLLRTIKNRLFTLEDEIPMHPGHGPSSTIGVEKRTNPFFA